MTLVRARIVAFALSRPLVCRNNLTQSFLLEKLQFAFYHGSDAAPQPIVRAYVASGAAASYSCKGQRDAPGIEHVAGHVTARRCGRSIAPTAPPTLRFIDRHQQERNTIGAPVLPTVGRQDKPVTSRDAFCFCEASAILILGQTYDLVRVNDCAHYGRIRAPRKRPSFYSLGLTHEPVWENRQLGI